MMQDNHVTIKQRHVHYALKSLNAIKIVIIKNEEKLKD